MSRTTVPETGVPGAGGPRRRRRVTRRKATGALAASVAASVAGAGLMLPTEAAVKAQHIVSVLKDEGTLSAEGFVPGEVVRARVMRGDVVVGSVTGRSDGTFEVNHDFCWDRFTPRIRPGDVVSLRSRAGVDRVRVTNVELTEGPTLLPGSNDSFTIKGTVTPRVPEGQLVAEARTNDPIRFRPLAPDEVDGVVGTIAYDAATGGAFTATFRGMDAQQQEAFNNLSEPSVQHAPAANEATIATGGDGTPVPGPGCGTTAPVVDSAVTATIPSAIGKRNADARLRVQGFAVSGSAVSVQLRDRDGTTRTLTGNVNAAQTWTASTPATQLRGLTGRVTVTADVDGVAARVGTSFIRDLVAPARPDASVASGRYRRTQFVSLSAGRGERVRYTLGNGGQASPTGTRGTLYRGGQIRIARDRVLKFVAVDAAGNVSRLARRDYRIGR